VYADIIVNISLKELDRPYTYRVPQSLANEATVGSPVIVPFGNGTRTLKGYIVSLKDNAGIDESRVKDIIEVCQKSNAIEERMIALAWWIKEQFGSTMNEALKCCLPVKDVIKEKTVATIVAASCNSREDLAEMAIEAEKKHRTAVARLYRYLSTHDALDKGYAAKHLGLSPAMLKKEEEKGTIVISSETHSRNPYSEEEFGREEPPVLNDEQKSVTDAIKADLDAGIRRDYLINGETGSGKTEVYMDIISHVIEKGKKVIMLIPEISLTYQTVARFVRRFGDRVCIMNSKLSQGERFDQFMKAKNGETDIMIGPRSALFAPFDNLGLIVVDEEHESSYKSESAPTYHAREVALRRAAMEGASVILGSATPSLESYTMAKEGLLGLFKLTRSAVGAAQPDVILVDMRKELKNKNRSIFSYALREQIDERLKRGEQIMLFLNRRGYSTTISCRECGTVIKCPHCDVSMTLHYDNTVKCHYCGYTAPKPAKCPNCGSPYIGAFGTGTQKVEEALKKIWPSMRIIRLDADSVRKKGSMDAALKSFAKGEADVLLGTQMIVKGHDFHNVTLVGILLADLSLYTPDFRSGERTYQLITQASGRAGRGKARGCVVIQTYDPENYAVVAAAKRDYEGFFIQETAFRQLMGYPPAGLMLQVGLSSVDEKELLAFSNNLAGKICALCESDERFADCTVIGPAQAPLYKANDVYRMVIYIKSCDHAAVHLLKDQAEIYAAQNKDESIRVEYDFNY